MNSNNEEYLDSLLSSAQSNNDNPQSALSRMSGKGRSSSSTLPENGGAGDIGALVNNSNGSNEDLAEIGSILNKLDNDELLDDSMADLLEDIEKKTDPGIPKFTVGNVPSSNDVRDPEEIALDEAIADAERMDAEIQSGKFDQEPEPVKEAPEPAPVVEPDIPIIDESQENDSFLEMAPEEAIPEDDSSQLGKETDSDADQTPEEILTDLLDEEDASSLVVPEENTEDSLSNLLDNIQDEEVKEEQGEGPTNEEPVLMEGSDEEREKVAPEEIDLGNIDDLSLDDLEADIDSSIVEEGASDGALEDAISEEVAPDTAGDSEFDDLLSDMESLIGGDEATEEAAGEPSEPDSIALEETVEEAEPAQEPAKTEASGEDELDLGDLEASLDDLLGGEAADSSSTDGEVADIEDSTESREGEGGESESDISIPDLDALMNSLANDEVEDIENTAHLDEEAGRPEDSEIPKEDILEALTEVEDLEGAMEPSLDDLAALEDRSLDEEPDDEEDSKPKKRKKEGFFARLLKALTQEDEDVGTEGLAGLTDENQQVLNELGGEDGKPAKKKKEKKEKKPKKEKPPKEKKPKEKKPPKPKKEKKPKKEPEPSVPEKAISPKKISICFIFAASLGILFCIPAFVLPERIAYTRAENAYSRREYTTAYKMFYGKELTSEQNVMYEQSRVLAWSERYLSGYQNYMAMNMKEEALDMLLMAMRNKEDMIEEAQNYGVEIQVQSVYDSIESVLSDSYGLSAADIEEINSIKKEREYTIRLMEIVGTLE
ncbi:hypothetical protein SAMN02910275_02150 [Butyrivibrio sp. INlla18]|uniref:hypothetical protein n=1 Tax=Butyrivibrio sp. INlla18 TaxID=1520806 RepID=UPI000890F398|nr:hypothetical protein [Butyrivibrio sp. INlla18]SDA68676.1 hypothetical protein SAMN02910275_02150 [Butyrivibrio sp. INlla18]